MGDKLQSAINCNRGKEVRIRLMLIDPRTWIVCQKSRRQKRLRNVKKKPFCLICIMLKIQILDGKLCTVDNNESSHLDLQCLALQCVKYILIAVYSMRSRMASIFNAYRLSIPCTIFETIITFAYYLHQRQERLKARK